MSGERNIYLSDVALDQALARWHTALAVRGLMAPLGSERIPLQAAAGRVTAESVWARISSPHYHACAMDGYAVRSDETIGATETAPLRLALDTQAHPVDTGDPLPPGTNAVIMIEQVQELDGVIEITAAAPPWQYVRAMGEDVVATELVLPANHRLRPQDLGAMAASGHVDVNVHRRPRVALIPTGTELVPPGPQVKPGDIIEYNTLVLAAMAEEAGCVVTRWHIVRDDYAAIKSAVQSALQAHDLVAINAGSSAGREDFSSRIVAELGELCVHGIAIRPGHPVILGAAGDAALPRALVGIPGYPVSAVVAFDLLLRPLLLRWQGLIPPRRSKLAATLTRKVVSPPGDDEFVRVTLGRVGERVVATPLAGGAGVITSLVKADGVLLVPRFSEGFHAGAQVEVELHCAPEKVDNTILAIGSHDMALDLLADAIKRVRPELSLSSAHVGSMGGLLALQRGEAHLAGSHLLDEESGEYNLAAIRRMLTPHGVRVMVLGFVERVQGLIVSKGNPLGLRRLADIARTHVTFVNRQRGAGTRVLLDFQLKQNGIDPGAVRGYERQEYTHLAVAAAVASGVATCGLGILAAARALNLDFVPLFNERYDLVVPVQHFDSAKLQLLLDIIRSEDFRRAVDERGGYGVARMGEVLAEL